MSLPWSMKFAYLLGALEQGSSLLVFPRCVCAEGLYIGTRLAYLPVEPVFWEHPKISLSVFLARDFNC
jgi:hypothetical protein